MHFRIFLIFNVFTWIVVTLEYFEWSYCPPWWLIAQSLFLVLPKLLGLISKVFLMFSYLYFPICHCCTIFKLIWIAELFFVLLSLVSNFSGKKKKKKNHFAPIFFFGTILKSLWYRKSWFHQFGYLCPPQFKTCSENYKSQFAFR